MNALALFALVASATWPPASLDAQAAARVERGETVKTRALANGVIRFSMAASIDAPTVHAFTAARDICASMQRGEDAPKIWFLLPKGVEEFLKRPKPEATDAALKTLPSMDCRGASALERYYVLAHSSGKFPFPESTTLLRQDKVVVDGVLTMTMTQILGGLGGSAMKSETTLLPMPNGQTAYVERGTFQLPSIIPEFLVKQMMDTPDDKNPQLKRLAELRALAKKLSASAEAQVRTSGAPETPEPLRERGD